MSKEIQKQSTLQNTYYITRIIEAVLAISTTLLLISNYSNLGGIDPDFLLGLIIFLLVVIILSIYINEKRFYNPWPNYAAFLNKKRRIVEKSRVQIELARVQGYKKTAQRKYREMIQYLIDDLKDIKLVALSREENDVANELQTQIDEYTELLQHERGK